ncbi:hypothetical protein DPEC_G00134130 [Dallia pectoralis]|uniref:Uncharacterized protein n=1 Tax=Dallia pectoralis TaxID=75939 RepID=A0ACC2GRN9_DALPE|nr:hypothetical protein DPEC_G00134130 [Dallia pectoralis]
MESQIRQNYHRDCEAAINRMINLECMPPTPTLQCQTVMSGALGWRPCSLLCIWKTVDQALLDLHKISSDKVDPHMDSTNNKLAEYLFDKHTLGSQS